MLLATPLLMSPILYFGEISGLEPRELPYSKQSRHQLSYLKLQESVSSFLLVKRSKKIK